MSFIDSYATRYPSSREADYGASTLQVTRNQGFIALISVIIIGFVLLIAVITLGGKSIASRFDLLNLEYKDSSYQLASACVQVAIIAVANDPSYNPSSPVLVNVGSKECTIVSVVPSLAQAQSNIKTTAQDTNASTILCVKIDSLSATVQSWQELETQNPVPDPCN